MLNLLPALENMQQGVVLLDADLQVLVFNTQAAELLRAPKGRDRSRYQCGENGRYTNSFDRAIWWLPSGSGGRAQDQPRLPPGTVNAACSNTSRAQIGTAEVSLLGRSDLLFILHSGSMWETEASSWGCLP
ncbi:PAS-domain containing protein [Rhizobium laguerreae]|uniref:PAS domain-containing protein n=1 Tax=Rhizobium laguerreae TaxID=1076926 RepID=A0A7Y2RC41_9HYPH|nr:PAS-domain containing protein [Rhizobium laguerreae]NNH68202.1 hypothetical protein [Rhizobium laguerreae]